MPFSDADAHWVIATGNAGKLREFQDLLAPCGLSLASAQELGITGPPETGQTFVENALLKARHAAAATELPAIADDSGLCVAGLAGGPGLRSARFAGPDATDAANVALLLERLAGADAAARSATFVCVIVALRRADDPNPIIATGRWHGRITAAPRGDHGFGYDPVFEIPALGKTAAELDQASKSELSHRGQATRQLLESWSDLATALD
jgi:XTP/dITP diphosphohydrolase